MDTMRQAARGQQQVPRYVHAFTAVFLLWVAGFGLTQIGAEPYPALTQPEFGYVAEADGEVRWVTVEYVVTLVDGTTQPIDYRDFYADAGAKAEYIAIHVIDPESADDPELVAWVRQRLAGLDLAGEPARLTVQTRETTFDRDSLKRGPATSPKIRAVVEFPS